MKHMGKSYEPRPREGITYVRYMIPTEYEVDVEEDLRTLHLSKDYYNRPELDLNGEPPW